MATTGDRALREGAAWLDISGRGRLRATGEDRARLLHALATNPVEGLADGAGTRAFFLNPQGRIQAFCRIYVSAEEILLDTDARRRERLAEYLDSYIIMDDVTLDDVTSATAAIAVEGPKALETVASALDGLTPPAARDAHAAAGSYRVFRSSLSGQDGCWILADRSGRDDLVAKLEAAGAFAAVDADFAQLRVVNRVPSLDDDYFDSNIPHETQQLQWVSFTKGCYTGQEIVERVRSQGRVNRLLTPIEVDGAELPVSREVLLDDKPMGEITSPTPVPDENRLLGFAILRRQAVEAAAGLSIEGREVRALPWE
jgi:folate-binding protein YgfZ